MYTYIVYTIYMIKHIVTVEEEEEEEEEKEEEEDKWIDRERER